MNAFVVKREVKLPNTHLLPTPPITVAPSFEIVPTVKNTTPAASVAAAAHANSMQTDAVGKDEEKVEEEFHVPAAFSPHVDALAAWLAHGLADQRQGCEIEGKIGTFSNGNFESVVPAVLFNAQLARCQRSASAGGVFERSERQTTATYHFANGVRGTQYSEQKNEFVRKRRISNYDLCFAEKSSSAGGALTIRLSHNIETPCQAPCEKVQMVRLRVRESFYYKQTWRFDFTYVRQGATKAEATAAPLQHEIELEYVGGTVSDTPQSGLQARARYLITSMLLKLHDLTLPTGGMNNNEPVALTTLQHVIKQD